jgi:antitoxin HicB
MGTHNNPHDGSTLDSFLQEEGILEHTQRVAVKRVIAYRLLDILRENNLTQADLARKMNTSKAAISRLLNPDNTSVTLNTLLKAAQVLGKTINFSIE